MTAIACGPFIGDFATELITFHPHVRWIKENLSHDDIIISTNANRTFMYEDWCSNVLPIEDSYTKNDDGQVGLYHTDISRRNYSTYIKEFKTNILTTFNLHKKELKLFPPSQPISFYQKQFIPIKIPTVSNSISSDTILYIPDISETEERLTKFLSLMLDDGHNVIVVGNSKIFLQDQNVLANNLDVYKYIIAWMSQCKMVVTPASYWTFLAKLQNVQVFSWGPNGNIYKYGNHSCVMPGDGIPLDRIFKQFLWFNKSVEAQQSVKNIRFRM